MFCLNGTMRYFLCPGKTDTHKGINFAKKRGRRILHITTGNGHRLTGL